MPRYGSTGRIAIVFVPTIAVPSAPTVVEITAGVRLSDYVTRDGLKTPSSGNTIDAADIGSAFNKTAAGTYGGDAAELMCHRDSKSASDIAWSTLERGTIGFLVVGRSGLAQNATTGLGTKDGVATVADRVEVYPVTVIARAEADTADNATDKFTASLAITGEPEQDAAVVAGS